MCCFDFSLFTVSDGDDKCVTAFTVVLVTGVGCVFGTVFVIGVALLGWSSFEFDTVQGNGWCIFLDPLISILGSYTLCRILWFFSKKYIL